MRDGRIMTRNLERDGDMDQASPKNEELKQAFKEALAEALHEQRDLLHEVFAEVLEDFAFAEAIRDGRQTECVERDEVFDVLEGRA